jgi:tRNA-specific 2-thiouridylase
MKILIALSGGVDSAVAAYLLKKQGHEVIGAIMSIWDHSFPAPKNNSTNACLGPEADDMKAAYKVANFLSIPLYVLNCSKEYKKIVIENFKNEYKEGRTPNPCVWCNAYIKFDILPTMAKNRGIFFNKFATGHYATVDFNDILGMYQLHKGFDQNKDQSYFLYRINQNILSKTLFPLGKYTKAIVRDIAKNIGLPVAEKHDSQDFYCGNYNDILQFPVNPGDIIDKNGKILGNHSGIWNYTIGKRKGLGLLRRTKNPLPLYVINILAKQNIVMVGTKEELYSSFLMAEKVVWNSIPIPKNPIEATAKIRQQHKPAKAIIIPKSPTSVEVKFSNPQISITTGQSVVFYKNDIVLGGGIINKK